MYIKLIFFLILFIYFQTTRSFEPLINCYCIFFMQWWLWPGGVSCPQLSTLLKLYQDNGRVIMKGSGQWSTVQSRVEFCLKWDLNLRPLDPKLRALTTGPPGCFFSFWKKNCAFMSILFVSAPLFLYIFYACQSTLYPWDYQYTLWWDHSYLSKKNLHTFLFMWQPCQYLIEYVIIFLIPLNICYSVL